MPCNGSKTDFIRRPPPVLCTTLVDQFHDFKEVSPLAFVIQALAIHMVWYGLVRENTVVW